MFQHTTEVDSLSCSNSSSQMPVNYCHGNSPPNIFDSLDSGGFFPPQIFPKMLFILFWNMKKSINIVYTGLEHTKKNKQFDFILCFIWTRAYERKKGLECSTIWLIKCHNNTWKQTENRLLLLISFIFNKTTLHYIWMLLCLWEYKV